MDATQRIPCARTLVVTTADHALETIRKYLLANRPHASLSHLLEDDSDWFAVTELAPPFTEWPVGDSFIFVSKATGQLWTAAAPAALDKVHAMR